MSKDWVKWHASYDDPTGALSERRGEVTNLIRKSLDGAAPGGVRVLSLCCGDARDVTDALRVHDRRNDVTGAVVELDSRLARAAEANLRSIDVNLAVIHGDAGDLATIHHLLPADLLLLVGIFGNIPESDIRRTITAVPSMCREGASVMWTRHRRPPDLTPSIRRWFDLAGCISSDFVSPGEGQFAVGREQVTRVSLDHPPAQLFQFQE